MDHIQLNKDEIKALGAKFGSGIKSKEELRELTNSLHKSIIEAALGREMTDTSGMRNTQPRVLAQATDVVK